jgi:outer membrane protein assembly factor BamB
VWWLRGPSETKWPVLRDIDGEHRAALAIGGPGRDTIHGVFAIGDDRVIAGSVWPVREGAAPGWPGRQGYVARIGLDGELRWRVPLEADRGASAVDLAGHRDQVVVVGVTFGSLRIAGVPVAFPAGELDCFVAALDAETGALRWIVPCGASDEGAARAVAVDEDGTIYVSGEYAASATFGGARRHVATVNPHARSPFVASYTPGGELRWVLAGRDATNTRMHAISVRRGVVVAGGHLVGPVRIGEHRVDGPPTGTCFVARLEGATGAVRWLRALNAAALCGTNATAVGDGWIVAGGDYTGPGMSLDGIPELASDAPRRDGWVGSFEPDTGALRWLRRIGTAGHDRVKDIAILGDEAVVVGDLFLTLVVDGITLRAAGSIDVYELHFDRTGVARAGRSLGGVHDETARRVALGPDGTVRIVGHFNHTMPLGAASLVSTGDYDGFLVEKSPLR